MQFLTEIPEHKWIASPIVAKWTSHPIAQTHDPLCWNIEHFFLELGRSRSGVSSQIRGNAGVAKKQTAVFPGPYRRHAFAKIEIEECAVIAAWRQTKSLHGVVYGRLVDKQLQELEKNTLARCLRTHEYGQISELDVSLLYRSDLACSYSRNHKNLSFDHTSA